jgi:hypothetical protein
MVGSGDALGPNFLISAPSVFPWVRSILKQAFSFVVIISNLPQVQPSVFKFQAFKGKAKLPLALIRFVTIPKPTTLAKLK